MISSSYDMIAVTKYIIAEKFPLPSLGISPGLAMLTTEPKSLADAVVRDWLYTIEAMRNLPYVDITKGESVWPVTLPLFRKVIIYDDGKTNVKTCTWAPILWHDSRNQV